MSRVTIHCSLSEYDDGTRFRVTRRSLTVPGRPLVDDDPALERSALFFTYKDRAVTPGGEYTYVIEYESGETWRIFFETGTVSVPEASFALMSNYPNPFNPSTAITYSVVAYGHVTVCIYDVSGRFVRTLLDEEKTPGTYVIQWDGLDNEEHAVASGTYFCHHKADKETAAHKILLMRCPNLFE